MATKTKRLEIVKDYEGIRILGLGDPDLQVQVVTFDPHRLPTREIATLLSAAPELATALNELSEFCLKVQDRIPQGALRIIAEKVEPALRKAGVLDGAA